MESSEAEPFFLLLAISKLPKKAYTRWGPHSNPFLPLPYLLLAILPTPFLKQRGFSFVWLGKKIHLLQVFPYSHFHFNFKCWLKSNALWGRYACVCVWARTRVSVWRDMILAWPWGIWKLKRWSGDCILKTQMSLSKKSSINKKNKTKQKNPPMLFVLTFG